MTIAVDWDVKNRTETKPKVPNKTTIYTRPTLFGLTFLSKQTGERTMRSESTLPSTASFRALDMDMSD